MRFLSLLVTMLCIVLTISPALAKDKKGEKPMDPQAMMELWQKLAQPGEPHKLFAGLVGSWTTTTKEWMEPGKPPTESTGTAEMRMLLDGRFLYQEYNAQMMGQPFSGIGIDAYDNLRKRYVTAWMDTMGTGIFLMEGTASPDGKTIAYQATKRGLTDLETTMEDTHVWLIDADGSHRRELGSGIDNRQGAPSDLALGTRRARAAALLSMSLPGGVYVYQGEELGLWEVEDLPDELREDPVWHRSGFTDRGRDGCRVPLPWSAEDGPSWLPRPANWQDFSVAAQTDDPESMLSLYREVFAQRRAIDGDLEWLDLGENVLAFRRNTHTTIVNLSAQPIDLPATPTLSSVPLTNDQLPPDAAAWLS